MLPKGRESEAIPYIQASLKDYFYIRASVDNGGLNTLKKACTFDDGTKVVWSAGGGIDSVKVYLPSKYAKEDIAEEQWKEEAVEEPYYLVVYNPQAAINDNTNPGILIYSIDLKLNAGGQPVVSLKRELTLSCAVYHKLIGYSYDNIEGQGYEPIKIVDPIVKDLLHETLDVERLYYNLFIISLIYGVTVIYDDDVALNSMVNVWYRSAFLGRPEFDENKVKTNFFTYGYIVTPPYQLETKQYSEGSLIEPVKDNSVLVWRFSGGYSSGEESVWTVYTLPGLQYYNKITPNEHSIMGMALRSYNLFAVLEREQYIAGTHSVLHAIHWKIEDWWAGNAWLEESHLSQGQPAPRGGCFMVGPEHEHIEYIEPPARWQENDGRATLHNLSAGAAKAWADAAWWGISITETIEEPVSIFITEPVWKLAYVTYVTYPKYGIKYWYTEENDYKYHNRLKIYDLKGNLLYEELLTEYENKIALWECLCEMRYASLDKVKEVSNGYC